MCVVFWWLARLGIAAPFLPVIPANNFNITNYGGISSATLTNTAAISNAIFAANAAGGGTVEIPAGTYLSGSITLKSRINLQIDAGATLKMLPYLSFPSTATELISASGLNNIEISGSGTIEGQGSAWWANNPSIRPVLLALNNCHTALVQNVTFQNSPKQHITAKGTDDNLTIQAVTINSPSTSPNTDGIDLIGTSCLVQNCSISAGDDNIAIGSTGGTANGILVTNCSFGSGHGMSIGGNTAGGVSNLTVINCSFNGTQYGIRMKSDNATSSGGSGGIAQNLFYYNLSMTNITKAAIVVYSYYNEFGTPTGITPSQAAAQPIDTVVTNTPIWRNIVISNLTATVPSGGIAGILWGRTEMPITNILLKKISITAPGNLSLYNVNGLTIADAVLTISGSAKTYSIYNAQFAVSNSAPAASTVSLDGLAGANALALYKTQAAMSDAAALGVNPLLVNASTLSNSTSLSLSASRVVNFSLGTNAATVAVAGNLMLNGILNVTNAAGFGPGTYTLFTYTGALTGNPTLSSTPIGFICNVDTNLAGQVRLLVQPSTPSIPVFTTLVNSGGNLILGGTGGPPSSAYAVATSTNLMLPLTNWTLITNNYFDASGNFRFTNTLNPSIPQSYFRIQLP